MPQIGSEKDPISISPRRKAKIRGHYLKMEDRNKYYENYDKIFKSKTKEKD